MNSALTVTPLPNEVTDLPDFTHKLQLKTRRCTGNGSFSVVYSCLDDRNVKVAVKAITFPRNFPQHEKPEFLRKMRRELALWKELVHPNIVPLLGEAPGEEFESDYSCMVSTWMPNGTLAEYISQGAAKPSLERRIQLIQGTAAGLEYLHSKSIIHGDFHPGNILVDSDHHPRVTDFGYSRTLSRPVQLTYLWTESIRPGAREWVAPELLYPEQCRDIDVGATDIYSLGSIILFVLSGTRPWRDANFESQIKQFKNPPRPRWPVIPNNVWNFINRCWSPLEPKNRPPAQKVLLFCTEELEQLFKQSIASDINVVLFGPVGCGKSSIINLLAGEPTAHVSADIEPCTRRPQCYRVPIGNRQFRLWDTTGFGLPYGADINPLSPYEQAHAVLRDLPHGVHLILLCARKDEICRWPRGLYWFINDFLFGNHAPVAFVVTHFDTPDTSTPSWWEHNYHTLIETTEIPVQSIPHIHSTKPNFGQVREELCRFLETNTISAFPVPPHPILSSHEDVSTLSNHCGLSNSEAAALVDKFNRPRDQLNVVL